MTALWAVVFAGLLLLFGSVVPVSAQWRGPSCDVSGMQIVLLSRDSQSGDFAVVKRLGSSDIPLDELTEGDFRRRQLLSNDHLVASTSPFEEQSPVQTALLRGGAPDMLLLTGIEAKDDQSHRFLQDDAGTEGIGEELYYARECDCHSPQFSVVYCPFTVDSCRAPGWRNSNGEPGCLTYPRGREASRSIFLIAIVWFMLLFSILVFTSFGRNCAGCLITSCMTECFHTNCWNRKSAKRMLERFPDRARGMIRNNVLRRRRQLERRLAAENARNPPAPTAETEAGAAATPTDRANQLPVSLALKTRIYRAPRAVKMEAAAAAVAAATTESMLADPDTASVGAGSVSRRDFFRRGGSARSVTRSDNGDAASQPASAPTSPMRPPAILSLVMGRNQGPENQGNAHRTHQRRNSRGGSGADLSGVFDVDQADLDLLHNGGYEPTDNMDGELDNDCTICFAPIIDGDRVGSLECTHLFHADCLKTWILRRNCCPLCQSFQLATPQFGGGRDVVEDTPTLNDLPEVPTTVEGAAIEGTPTSNDLPEVPTTIGSVA